MKRPGFRQVWGQALERLGQGPLPAVTVLVGETEVASFGYDELGRRSSATDRDGASTTVAYDADSGRVASLTRPDGLRRTSSIHTGR